MIGHRLQDLYLLCGRMVDKDESWSADFHAVVELLAVASETEDSLAWQDVMEFI